jgi:hypothetical protein
MGAEKVRAMSLGQVRVAFWMCLISPFFAIREFNGSLLWFFFFIALGT